MKLSDLIPVLRSTPGQKIEFLLPDGRKIPSHYHLTEVACIRKDFIDCGGGLRRLDYCTLQLWATFDIEHRLSTDKFLSILEKSGKILPSRDIEAEVEYQDKVISQYPIESVQAVNGMVLIHLALKHTGCLAQDACGLNSESAPKSCCSPGSGCC